MNRARLIWGIICLALAGLLAVLNFALPENKMMFMVGDQNVPIIPAIILAIIGIVLLATAGGGTQQAAQATQSEVVQNPEKATLNKRLETMGWGLFLIMLGGFALVPDETVPKGLWSIGVGLIMLGLNAARYLNGIRMSGFTTFLGVVSLVSGILELFGNVEIGGAIFLIVLGAYLLVKPWFDQRQLFGKAEES